jgi:hypothetical protein
MDTRQMSRRVFFSAVGNLVLYVEVDIVTPRTIGQWSLAGSILPAGRPSIGSLNSLEGTTRILRYFLHSAVIYQSGNMSIRLS